MNGSTMDVQTIPATGLPLRGWQILGWRRAGDLIAHLDYSKARQEWRVVAGRAHGDERPILSGWNAFIPFRGTLNENDWAMAQQVIYILALKLGVADAVRNGPLLLLAPQPGMTIADMYEDATPKTRMAYRRAA